MRCQFIDGVCVNCGCKRSQPYPIRKCTPGLGDRVARRLASVGITKERAQAVAQAVGISDCGCQQRQQAINEWGAKYLGIAATSPREEPAPPVT